MHRDPLNRMPSRSLPLLLDVQGAPYLIEAEAVDFMPDGRPEPENIYPELQPCWDALGACVTVEDGETLCVMGRRFIVNMMHDVELVALALPGEPEYVNPEALEA